MPEFLGRLIELDGPVQIAVVGQRQGGHPQGLRPLQQSANRAGPVQQAVVAVAMQMGERKRAHGFLHAASGGPTGHFIVDDATPVEPSGAVGRDGGMGKLCKLGIYAMRTGPHPSPLPEQHYALASMGRGDIGKRKLHGLSVLPGPNNGCGVHGGPSLAMAAVRPHDSSTNRNNARHHRGNDTEIFRTRFAAMP